MADNAFKVHSKRVVSAGIAYETTSILKQVMIEGTGTNARLDDGRPEAGKTGTAENFGNAWFCGYTPDIASCVWVGYRGSNKPLEGIEGVGAVYGGTLPAAIWKDFMTTATRRLPPHDWPEPKQPMVFRDFKATTSFGYNPSAARSAAPRPPRSRSPSRRRPRRRAVDAGRDRPAEPLAAPLRAGGGRRRHGDGRRRERRARRARRDG